MLRLVCKTIMRSRPSADADTGMASSEIVSSHDLQDIPSSGCRNLRTRHHHSTGGSQATFRAVDEEAVVSFAKAATAAGVEYFLVVTAVGANPDAFVFYSRVKGHAEQKLLQSV